jgi:hypothetical protein
MSLEFFNATTSISRKYSREFWGKALELARYYGWRPMGTCPPDRQLITDWLGLYLTNDGQMVMREDALFLADALERSLDDIPNDRSKMNWTPNDWMMDELPEWLSPEEVTLMEEGLEEQAVDVAIMHPFEFFAGDEKHHLLELIRFCRLGSFTIL